MQAYAIVFGKMLRFSKVPLTQVWESRHWLEQTSACPPDAHRQVEKTRPRVAINVLWGGGRCRQILVEDGRGTQR